MADGLAVMNGWQRASIQAAATYLRERIGRCATDPRAASLYEGLIEVLDPLRRGVGLQRERALATKRTASIQAAASYIRERIARCATDSQAASVYQGLLEVLDPSRRVVRMQREMAQATKSAVNVQIGRERRKTLDRRVSGDRRKVNLGSPTGVERRSGQDRRNRRDRRTHRGN